MVEVFYCDERSMVLLPVVDSDTPLVRSRNMPAKSFLPDEH